MSPPVSMMRGNAGESGWWGIASRVSIALREMWEKKACLLDTCRAETKSGEKKGTREHEGDGEAKMY